MSFILDALRKSEHERQRQTGPALVEVAVAAPKSRTNVWATAAIGLLVVNLVAIGLLLLVKARDEQPAAAVGESAPTEARKPAAAPPAALAQPQSQPQTQAAAPAAQASITQALPPPSATRAPPPPMLQPAAGPPPPASRNPLAAEVSAGAGPVDGEVAARAATPPAGPPAVMAAPTQPGSVVYQSLPEAGPVAGSVPAGSRPAANLPTADELAASGGLPDMRLELHVYSNRPQERFVFVNGRRYREGDTTQEGASVEEITRDGVVMNLRGSRFLLPRD